MGRWLVGILSCFFSLGVAHAGSLQLVNSQKIIELALQKNLDIATQQVLLKTAQTDLTQAKSLYDTTLQAGFHYQKDQFQKSTAVFGTENSDTLYSIGLSKKIPSGTQLTLGLSHERISTNSPFATTNPAHDSRIILSVRQPLLKNAFGTLDRQQITQVKKNLEALDWATQAQIEAHIYTTLMTYWQWVFNSRYRALEKEGLNWAHTLLQANQNKVATGLIESTELAAYQAYVELAKDAFVQAESAALLAQQELCYKLDLVMDCHLRLGNESFANKKKAPINVTILEALSHRVDYKALKKELEASQIRLAMSKNNLWPQIDVVASLDLNGLDTSLDSAVNNLGDGHPRYGVGMELAFPLENRLAKSALKKSRFEKERRLIEIKKKESEIVTQITQAIQRVNAQAKRVGLIHQLIQNQEQKLKSEQEKMDQGRSDSDIVIRFQKDYLDAKKMLLQAQLALKLANMDLIYAQGKILNP